MSKCFFLYSIEFSRWPEFSFLPSSFQAAVNNCSQLVILCLFLVRSCSTSSDLPLHSIIDSLGKSSVSVLLQNMKQTCGELFPVFQTRPFHLRSPCHIFVPPLLCSSLPLHFLLSVSPSSAAFIPLFVAYPSGFRGMLLDVIFPGHVGWREGLLMERS